MVDPSTPVFIATNPNDRPEEVPRKAHSESDNSTNSDITFHDGVPAVKHSERSSEAAKPEDPLGWTPRSKTGNSVEHHMIQDDTLITLGGVQGTAGGFARSGRIQKDAATGNYKLAESKPAPPPAPIVREAALYFDSVTEAQIGGFSNGAMSRLAVSIADHGHVTPRTAALIAPELGCSPADVPEKVAGLVLKYQQPVDRECGKILGEDQLVPFYSWLRESGQKDELHHAMSKLYRARSSSGFTALANKFKARAARLEMAKGPKRDA